MEWLVKEYDGTQLGVTQPSEPMGFSDELRVVWENGATSYPWWKRKDVAIRYEVIRELTDKECEQYMLIWKIKAKEWYGRT